jgi:Heparinase II/III-like protein/Heparinase II/III N-terminus
VSGPPAPRSLRSQKLEWYLRRLERMSVSEVGWRLSDQVRKWAWTRRQVPPATATGRASERRRKGPASLRPTCGPRVFRAALGGGVLSAVSANARGDVMAAADELLSGRWRILGAVRTDMADPDWFLDPVTGRRAPQADYCFSVDHRAEGVTGNVKQLWELSRLQHVTVLAGAFALSGDERYADLAARHLRSWWSENPFLSGVHWTSGIEVGLRLITWVWARRLLDRWEHVRELFEDNDLALAQIWWHQRYLSAFRSRGSSANNHVIAEAAGQLVAGLAFPWFEESDGWTVRAAELLEMELARNTFPSGVNREMAFDYHGFVAELGLVAAVEADSAGRPLSERTWELLCRMLDVVAATLDVQLRAPRQGDGDDGRALVLGAPGANRWQGLLAFGAAVFGAPAWWPTAVHDAESTLLASMAGYHRRVDRPRRRPSHFAESGLTIMRSLPEDGGEIWCRCDAGPHGYLSIAAHAHADALAVEVRHRGTDILADPGTYCYQGEPAWRRYFRSTLGHNTVELAGRDQSVSGGPTLWTRHAHGQLVELSVGDHAEVRRWSGEHDGYAVLQPPARHRRTVQLSSRCRLLEIVDDVETEGAHPVRMAFHLGPRVQVRLEGTRAELTWDDREQRASATLCLPDGLAWTTARGVTDPVLGWYSSGFGEKEPATTLLGEGLCRGHARYATALQFHQ